MDDVNQMRCFASDVIIQMMNADAPAQEKADHLMLLWDHAASAYERVVGKRDATSQFIKNVQTKVEEKIAQLPPKDKENVILGLNRIVEVFRNVERGAETTEDWETRWKVEGDNPYDGKHRNPDISGDDMAVILARTMNRDRLQRIDSITISLGHDVITYTQIANEPQEEGRVILSLKAWTCDSCKKEFSADEKPGLCGYHGWQFADLSPREGKNEPAVRWCEACTKEYLDRINKS